MKKEDTPMRIKKEKASKIKKNDTTVEEPVQETTPVQPVQTTKTTTLLDRLKNKPRK